MDSQPPNQAAQRVRGTLDAPPRPAGVVTTLVPCPACGASHGTVLSERDGKTGEALRTVECGGCGLGRIDPLPDAAALAAWYAAHYRQDYKGQTRPRATHVLRAARVAASRWRWLSERAPQLAGSALPSLDVGASSGEFVAIASAMGLAARGVEPHAGYGAHAREVLGLDVRSGTLDAHTQALQAEGPFALISMFHVLEHMADPLATLRQLRSLLGADGLLFIEVPNSCLDCAPSNVFFRAHTLYFSAHSLLAVARAAGLEPVGRVDDAGNLRVLLRVAEPVPAAEAYAPDNGLSRAARARRWGPYLWRQLLSGRPLRRLGARRAERRAAQALGGDARADRKSVV